MIVAHNDTETFQAFLDTMSQEVPAGDKTVYLVLDNASWHKAKGLNWHHIQPLYLPPYIPTTIPLRDYGSTLKVIISPAISQKADKNSVRNYLIPFEI